MAHVAMVLTGGRAELAAASSETLMRFGASYAPLVREGQLHRLIASMFLHIGLLHLCLNSAALVSIGPTLERDYGRVTFVAIYLSSGLVGSLASVVWHHSSPVVSAGASGALCGAIAAGAVHAHFGRRFDERRMLVTWAVVTLAFGVLVGADNAAHVGGLAAGGLLGAVIRRRAPRRTHAQLPAALVLSAVVVAFTGSVLNRDRSDTASAAVNRGVDFARGGDFDRAIVAYRRALELEPGDAIAHYDLGLALERQGQFDAAITHLERAYQVDPDDGTSARWLEPTSTTASRWRKPATTRVPSPPTAVLSPSMTRTPPLVAILDSRWTSQATEPAGLRSCVGPSKSHPPRS